MEGTTPLHLCMSLNNSRVTDKLIMYLSQTDFDHHARFIMKKVPALIDQVPMAMNVYLEKRLRTVHWVEGYTRGKVANAPDCEFNMGAAEMWSDQIEENLEKRMFEDSNTEMPMQMLISDLPGLHQFGNTNCINLLNALAETDNKELFENATLRAIIERNFPVVKHTITWKLFIPYVTFVLVFMFYSTWVFEQFDNLQVAYEKMSKECGIIDAHQTYSNFNTVHQWAGMGSFVDETVTNTDLNDGSTDPTNTGSTDGTHPVFDPNTNPVVTDPKPT